MPYAPAIVVRRGGLLFLPASPRRPSHHSHPHREEEFDLPRSMREQAVLAMENLEQHAGRRRMHAGRSGVGHALSHRRQREQDDLNRVWAEYLGAHRPTTTTVEVSRLATHANCKVEITAIAVTDV